MFVETDPGKRQILRNKSYKFEWRGGEAFKRAESMLSVSPRKEAKLISLIITL